MALHPMWYISNNESLSLYSLRKLFLATRFASYNYRNRIPTVRRRLPSHYCARVPRMAPDYHIHEERAKSPKPYTARLHGRYKCIRSLPRFTWFPTRDYKGTRYYHSSNVQPHFDASRRAERARQVLRPSHLAICEDKGRCETASGWTRIRKWT
jgi:hypothetical protein